MKNTYLSTDPHENQRIQKNLGSLFYQITNDVWSNAIDLNIAFQMTTSACSEKTVFNKGKFRNNAWNIEVSLIKIVHLPTETELIDG